MNRRQLLLSLMGVGGAAVAVASKSLPVVEMPVDCDIAVCSIRQAMALAGPVPPHFTYVLTVHPEDFWAVPVLINIPEAHFRIEKDPTLRYVDEWSLRGAEKIVHSNGA